MSIKDLGAPLWLNWQSGLLFNMVGVEFGYQGAVIGHQNGANDLTETTGAFAGLADFSPPNVQFYQGDANANSVVLRRPFLICYIVQRLLFTH